MAQPQSKLYPQTIPIMQRTNAQHQTTTPSDPFEPHGPFRIRYAAGELIHQSGTFAAGATWIASGIVQESCGKENAEGTTVSEPLGPGDLLGIEILLPGTAALHCGSARAVTDVQLSFLERSAFESAMEDDLRLRSYVLERMAERVFSLKRSLRVAADPLEVRLQRLLSILAEKSDLDPTSGETALPPEIDRRVLAEFLSVSTRRVSRALDVLGLTWTVDGNLRVTEVRSGD